MSNVQKRNDQLASGADFTVFVSQSDVLIAGYASAILNRLLFFNSYILNTPESINIMRNFFTQHRKNFIQTCLGLEPYLYKELLLFYTNLEHYKYDLEADGSSKNFKNEFSADDFLFTRGYSTAYLVRILDPEVKEFSFFSVKRAFVSKFSCLVTETDLLIKNSLLHKEENFNVENGGQYVSRSLNSIFTTVFNSQLFEKMREKISIWRKLPSLINNFTGLIGNKSLLSIHKLDDSFYSIVKKFETKKLNLRHEIGQKISSNELKNGFEAETKYGNTQNAHKIRNDKIKKFRTLDIQNTLKNNKQFSGNQGGQLLGELYKSFRNSVDAIVQTPYFNNSSYTSITGSENENYQILKTQAIREGIYSSMQVIQSLDTSLTVDSIYDYFCLSLKLGSLSYFHKYKSSVLKKFKKITKSTKSEQFLGLGEINLTRSVSKDNKTRAIIAKEFGQAMFYLMDSEISLQTGNTEEFYNETLTFISENMSYLKFFKVCHLFYKVLQVTVIQNAAYGDNSTDNIAKLIKSDMNQLIASYPKFDPENLQINKIQEDKTYKFLYQIYNRIV